ncbi:MAG: prolipoprotein diacylglyceryl transferase [bacterium]|nr:prolipoprotein diacylglyceryl transferase [bacterium]
MTLFPSRFVAVNVAGFSVHWYGLMYLTAFLLAFVLLPRIQHDRRLDLTKDQWASLLSAAVIGVIVGGRLGYVLFYAPHMLTADLLEVFRVWHGGMSSHGGFIGVAVALLFAMRPYKGSILAIADVAVVPIAIGLALGRFGNFINQELYGTVTQLPWGMEIPGVEGLRHPLPLYGMAKDLFIATICYYHLHVVLHARKGRTLALFLISYGILRFLLEYVRYQQYAGTDLLGVSLTRGQVLSVPIVLVGLYVWRRVGRM